MTPTEHLFVIQRSPDWHEATVAILYVTSQTPDKAEAGRAFREAVAAWLEQSDEGQSAWKESEENFNIGDLAQYADLDGVDPSLIPFFESRGISSAALDVISAGEEEIGWAFDTVLGGVR